MPQAPARRVRLLVDVQSVQGQSRSRGLGRYTRDLATALIRQSPHPRTDIELSISPLATQDPALGLVAPGTFRAPAAWWPPPADPQRRGEARRTAIVNQELVKLAVTDHDAILYASVMEGLMGGDTLVSLPNNRRGLEGIVCAAVLYDLIPHLFPRRYLDAEPEVRRWYAGKLRFLQECDLLLAISEATKADAVNHLNIPPHRIAVIGAGAAPVFAPTIRQDDGAFTGMAARLGINRPYVLTAGAPEWRKNLRGILNAYATLPARLLETHQLVAVTQMTADERSARRVVMASAGAPADSLVVTGRISDAALAELYRNCAVFVFPSLYEGFGLPLLEAIRCGAPALGSDCSSMPEVVAREDCVFDPRSITSMAERITFALDHPAWRAEVAASQSAATQHLTWETVASRALSAIEGAVDEQRDRRRSRVGRRRELAVVMPRTHAEASLLPGADAVLRHLGRTFAVRWFDPARPPRATALDDRRWEVSAGGSDAELANARLALYEIDDDPVHHLGVLRHLLQHRGIVILHGTVLERLAAAMHGRILPWRHPHDRPDWGLDPPEHGTRGPVAEHDPGGESHRLLSTILDHADAVVVELDYARRRLEVLVPGIDVPIAVIPTAAFPPQPAAAPAAGEPAVGFVITEPLSAPDGLAVAALAASPSLGRTWVFDARPGAAPRPQEPWQQQGWSRGASAGGYDGFLGAVDVVVMCGAARLEITARYAVRALALGTAVVARPSGCLAELPADAVHRVGSMAAAEVVAAVRALRADPAARASGADAGLRWATERAGWATTAQSLEAFIELVADFSERRRSLATSLAAVLGETRTADVAGDRLQ